MFGISLTFSLSWNLRMVISSFTIDVIPSSLLTTINLIILLFYGSFGRVTQPREAFCDKSYVVTFSLSVFRFFIVATLFPLALVTTSITFLGEDFSLRGDCFFLGDSSWSLVLGYLKKNSVHGERTRYLGLQ